MLVFTHPECGPCGDLMPDLARWQRALAERVTIALISQGGEARNREAHADDDQVDNVLLEHEGSDELFKTYGMRGTPSAVAVTPDGRIATVTTESDIEIEQLLRHVLHHHTNDHETEPARSDPAYLSQPGLA
jgi:acyl-CoA synthetase (NDP forming)